MFFIVIESWSTLPCSFCQCFSTFHPSKKALVLKRMLNALPNYYSVKFDNVLLSYNDYVWSQPGLLLQHNTHNSMPFNLAISEIKWRLIWYGIVQSWGSGWNRKDYCRYLMLLNRIAPFRQRLLNLFLAPAANSKRPALSKYSACHYPKITRWSYSNTGIREIVITAWLWQSVRFKVSRFADWQRLPNQPGCYIPTFPLLSDPQWRHGLLTPLSRVF